MFSYLDQLLVSLLKFKLDSVTLGVGLSPDVTLDSLSKRLAINRDLKVAVDPLEVKVLGFKVEVVNSVSILDLEISLLAGNSVDVDVEVPVLGGVDVHEVELGLPVGLQLELQVGESGGQDGGTSQGSSGLSLQLAGPEVAILLAVSGQSSSLVTIAISVGQLVVEVQVKESVILAVATIKLKINGNGLAVGEGDQPLHVSDGEVDIKTLGSV